MTEVASTGDGKEKERVQTPIPHRRQVKPQYEPSRT